MDYKVTVEFLVYHADDGNELVFPSETDLQYDEYNVTTQIEDAEKRLTEAKSHKKELESQSILAELLILRRGLDALRRQHHGINQLKPLCEAKCYTLKAPTYGEFLMARDEFSSLSQNGEVNIDYDKVYDRLLRNSIEGMKGEEVAALPVSIGLKLMQQIKDLLSPSPDRINFYQWRLTTISEGASTTQAGC